ncbi:MAG: hypothetical protein QOJ01_136 [Solirubrobacterales bacterium]|nr:hypothetical protein [Solirubrobacterales bacterium]
MTERGESHDFLSRDVGADERPGLVELAERLEAERPLPAPGFRGELRRRLVDRHARRAPIARARARLLVAAYGGSGALLLVIAAAGVAGIGPFGTG